MFPPLLSPAPRAIPEACALLRKESVDLPYSGIALGEKDGVLEEELSFPMTVSGMSLFSHGAQARLLL